MTLREEYYKKLKQSNSIEILFVGQDPFPDKSNMDGIAFCKAEIDDMKKYHCSGRHLLNGLGINIENSNEDPKDIFFYLLSENRIGVINASVDILSELPIEKRKSSFIKSEGWNKEVIMKAKNIVTTVGAKKILAKYKSYNDFKEKLRIALHPSIKNANKSGYRKLWKTPQGLLKFVSP